MRKGKIGFGIVGYGVIGTFHAKAIRDARDAELVAVCDTDPKQEAVMRKEGWNVPFYARETEMYRKESDLDAVCICTPSGLHYRSAVNAARHGRHVLSEKPLDITLAHMDRMIDACDEAGVKLGCIFQRHADPDHILAHKAIRKGLLGRLVLGDCYQKYYRAPAYYKSAAWRGTWKLDGGGALMNQCVHGIDALLWLMGDDVASVFSYSGTQVREIEVEDTSVSVVRFKSGAYGTIVGTTSVIPAQPSRTEIHGDKGSLVLSNDGVRCWTSRLVKGVHKEQPVDLAKRFRTRKPAGKGGPGGAADPKAIGWYGHTAQVQDFCRAILNDRQPIINGPQARKPVALILAIYKSAKTGKEVVLD